MNENAGHLPNSRPGWIIKMIYIRRPPCKLVTEGGKTIYMDFLNVARAAEARGIIDTILRPAQILI